MKLRQLVNLSTAYTYFEVYDAEGNKIESFPKMLDELTVLMFGATGEQDCTGRNCVKVHCARHDDLN